jgi:pimeloyl-ACP methyl ester carboxylesterase
MWGDEPLLQSLDIRLIAIDRPGVGDSSFQPGRRISDWPADVLALADALGLARFSVLGYSGGGSYAAACAALIPDRLVSAGMVSSVTAFDKPELLEGLNPRNVQFLRLSIEKPLLFRLIYWQMSLLAKYAPQKYLENALKTFEAADRDAFAQPRVHQSIFAAYGSLRGQQWDTRLVLSAWDFNLQDIRMPVYLWQGDQDHNASPAMGRHLEKSIPNSRMTFLPGEGHISLIVKNAAAILKTLTEQDIPVRDYSNY